MSTTAVAPVAASIPLPVGRLAGVGAVVFFANAALLVLQLAAGRLLSPFIGSSLETWTSIIGVFLTGIALGNGFGGKLADRYPTPRTLATLLLLGALGALWMIAFPLLLGATGAHKSLPLGPRIPILAAVLCLPAGFVLSLLTPLAIKLGLPDVGHTGRVAGLVFALSTLGCLIGNYLTGFYLIPTFTLNTIVAVSAGVLLALAAVSLVVVRGQDPTPQPLPPRGEGESGVGDSGSLPASQSPLSPPPPGPRPAEIAPASEARGAGPNREGAGGWEPPAHANPHAFPDIRQAYLIVFLASFCGMALELTASRLLAQQLGVSLFTWTGIIGVMLAGTALGNFTGGQVADRVARPNSPVAPRVALAGTLILAGAASVFVFVALALVTHFHAFQSWEPIRQVMAWTFSLFFLPMYALGLVSPQVIRLAVPDVAHAGRVAGRVYAWSTAGAIAGTFAAGYVLLSTFGMNHTILGASVVLTLSSLTVVNIWGNTRAAARGEQPPGGYASAGAGAGALLYLFSIVLGGVTGGFILTSRAKESGVVQVESNYYTIKVNSPSHYSNRPGARDLNLDRLLHSIVDTDDPTYLYYTHEYIQVEFLWLAKSRAPEPRALVIGGGGYTFPRYAMETVFGARVDVVEIDPKVTQVAHDHLGLKRDYPNLRAIHMDGRQFVSERAAPGSYDLVVQDAVNDFSVPAHLMTKEYNDAVKAALKPDGGVYLLTIIDSVARGKLWKAGMATLEQSFKHVALLRVPHPQDGEHWYDTRHVLVIYASDTPFSAEALERALAEPGERDLNDRLAALAAAPIDLPGGGAPSAAVRVALASQVRRISTYTLQVPPEAIKPFTDAEPGVILTDQFCPIDNLMAEVFRSRMRDG